MIFDLANGTPDINDPSFLVPARTGSSQAYKIQLPTGVLASFAVIPVTVTKGGITPRGSYQTSSSHRIGGSSTTTTFDAIASNEDIIMGSKFSGGNLQLRNKNLKFNDSGVTDGAVFDGFTNFPALGINQNLRLTKSGASITGTTGDLTIDGSGGDLVLASGDKVVLTKSLIPNVAAPTIGTGADPFPDGYFEIFRSDVYYEGASLLTSVYGRLASGNTWSGTNNFNSGKIIPRFHSGASVSTVAGEIVIWGDTGSGNTYLVFDNGGGQLKVQLA